MPLRKIDPGMKLAVSISAEAGDDYLAFLKQMGISWVTLWTTAPRAGAEYYRQVKRRFANAGLRVYGFGNGSLHNQDAIVLGLENRDAKIEEYKLHLRALGEADIPYTTYAHMANGVWSSEPENTRGGASARSFDVDKEHVGYRGVNRFHTPLSHGRVYSEEEIWDNFRHFVGEIVPVAEEQGIRIGIHPDDPPQLKLAGVPRCIFSSYDGYQRAMAIADSRNIGICFCIGCWLEGGPIMGKDTDEALREFGQQDKVFKVHFRNVDRPLPRFVETFVDDGYYDMRRAIDRLKEIEFNGVLIPDHVPLMGDDLRIGTAYTIGWIKAMIDGAEGQTS